MAKPQLNELFDWLKRNPVNHFEIYDVDKDQVIEKCAGYVDLTKSGATLEQYFTQLIDKGVRTVQIQKKRKNGSTYIREGCGLNYGLTTDAQNNVAASGSPVYPGATQQHYPPVYPSPSFGLGSPAMGGLGFPEIMSMRSQSDRFEETKRENKDLKDKVERLEAENKTLERDNLKLQLGVDNKPSAVDKLVESLAANPAALATVIQSFKGSPSVPGLNAPQGPVLSDTKSTMVDLITNNQQITDDHVTAAYYVLVEALKNNQAFLQEYYQLLINHSIIQDGNNGNSNS